MSAASHPKRPADVHNAFRPLFASLILETLGFTFSGSCNWGNIPGVLIGTAITFFLMVKANESLNWPRILLTLLMGLLTLLFTFGKDYRRNPGETIIDAISTLITVVATVLLFIKSSNAWFANAHR